MTPSDDAARARRSTAVIFLVNGAVLGSWAPHIAIVQERIGLSPGRLAVALLAMAAGALVTMPLSGLVIARVGSGPVTRIASPLFCLALLLPANASGLPALMMALAIFGGLNGALDIAMNAHGVAIERRAGNPVMSSFHGMFSLGGLVGAGIGGLALTYATPFAHVLAAAAVAGLAGGVAGRGLLSAAVDRGAGGRRFAWPRPAAMSLGGLAFLVLLSEGAMLDWSAVHLRTGLGTSPAFAAAGFAAFSAAMALARFAGDPLRRRVGAVRLVRWSAALAAGGFTLGLLLATPTAAILGFTCAGLGLANISPVIVGAAGRLPGETPSTAIAAIGTIGYAGYLAGPPLIGLVAEVSTLAVALGTVVLACTAVGLAAHLVRWAEDP